MRTDEEIASRIQDVENSDWMGTTRSDLLSYLPFAAAKKLLKPEATEDGWKVNPRDRDSVLAEMLAYMPFAWGKANNCRGLSAGRSLDHMKAWLWMIGEDEAVQGLDDYELYGKPQLRAICDKFGWDWRKWDNDEWTNHEGEHGAPADRIPPVQLAWAA